MRSATAMVRDHGDDALPRPRHDGVVTGRYL
jgi:hypothetical protein